MQVMMKREEKDENIYRFIDIDIEENMAPIKRELIVSYETRDLSISCRFLSNIRRKQHPTSRFPNPSLLTV
jgi:hypothetical protein